MKIKIISVGKIKEKYLIDGIKEYSKRLSRYVKLEIIELPDEKCPENISLKDQEIIMQKEAERIINKIDNEYVISLAIEGESFSSEELSEKIKNIMTYSNSNICFIIGGSLGLHESVSLKSDMKLSFSKMTFPHQLMRLILLEQIYRSFRIINNEPYHK